MRWAGAFLLCPCLAFATGKASDVARDIREISLDPAACFRVRELALPKDEIRLFFTDGYLIFAKPVAGVRTAAVFSTDVEGGEAEVLLLPPNRAERQSLAARTGSPNLDEHFSAAVLLFSDDTYAKLTEQITQNPFNRKSPEMGALMADHWNSVVRNIAASFQTRMVLDLLSNDPRRPGFFAASVNGKKLGTFDLYYDARAVEQIVLGKFNARDGLLFFDVWNSFVAKPFRDVIIEPDFATNDFRIDATLDPDLAMQVVTHIRMKAGSAPLAVLAFDIAGAMKVSSASVDGAPAEVFQRDSARSDLMRNVGNEMCLIVPSKPFEPGSEHELEIHHAGKVIFDAGNRVYYVGARANWFPANGRQLATFDLTFRYPKDLDLVTAGELVDDRIEGDIRITRRKTSAPVRMAGFNLGRYLRVRTSHDGYTVEVCANRSTEPALAPKRPIPAIEMPPRPIPHLPEVVSVPEPVSRPSSRLQELAFEVMSALEFMASDFGPPALPNLTVAPVPGRFGQGFPGLIYLSTMSYLTQQEQALRNLDAHGRLFFSDLLCAHETAHQWWGTIVTAAGYHDEWLMEALADYSALLYLEKKHGPQPVAMVLDTYKANLLLKTATGKTVESTGPIVMGARLENSQAPQAYNYVTYGKGSWILHMMRRRMGDDRFLAMLADLRKNNEQKPLSTESFRTTAVRFLPPQSPDPDLENFFDQWVYGTGIPSLKLSYSVKGKAPQLRLSGTVTQSEVDDDFSVPVPVEIQFGHGKTMTRWVRTANGAVTFSVALKQAPLKVLLDPGSSVLRR